MIFDLVVLILDILIVEVLVWVCDFDFIFVLVLMVFVVCLFMVMFIGYYLGCVYLQWLFCDLLVELVGGVVDIDLFMFILEILLVVVICYFVVYNLVCGLVVDDENYLLGVVIVDDLFDYLLLYDWCVDMLEFDFFGVLDRFGGLW